MSFMFKWLKDCYNYYILGQIAPELISKINDETTLISQEVKRDLIASIMTNNPTQLVDQINDEKNAIPPHIKEALLQKLQTAVTSQGDHYPINDDDDDDDDSTHSSMPDLVSITCSSDTCDQDEYKSDTDSYNPMEYRGFMIRNKTLKAKVDLFLDGTPIYSTFPSTPSTYFNKIIDNQWSAQQLEDRVNAFYRYGNDHNIWESFEERQYEPLVVSWQTAIRMHLVTLINHHLNTVERIDCPTNKALYIQNEISRINVTYVNIFKNLLLGEKFLHTVLVKQHELITTNGLASSLLVLAYYRPDLVCDDIYPAINRDSQVYIDINHQKLAESPVFGELYAKYSRFL